MKVNNEQSYVEHPLQNKWSLWYFKLDRKIDWKDCQHFVASVDTIENFWTLMSYTETPSRISNGCDYSFFKHGVNPTWEDPENQKGGRWIVNLDKKLTSKELDSCWSGLLMAIVGDEFGEFTEEVCGVVLNIRPRGNKLAIWTKFKDSCKVNETIGSIFRGVLTNPNIQMIYQSHDDAANK